MTDTTRKTETASIKSIMAGGVWRSRRVVAALAITAGLSFGVVGATVPQADAAVGWCYRCTMAQPSTATSVGHAATHVYTVRPSVYASAY
jgi:hypothetical protein